MAQTLGGSSTFSFLRLPHSPQLTSLGGINVSRVNSDLGLAFNNPSLLNPSMHTQLHAVFNSFYAGIEAYHLSFGFHHAKLNTSFLWGVQYLAYGEIPNTDASGNILGTFRANDWVMQLGASRRYLEKWRYGAAVKFINSSYGQFRSNGIALDFGVAYYDSLHRFSASVLAKNLGFQLKQYAGAETEELPFDLQAGLTRKLQNAPLSFSLTTHSIHHFDITYNDTSFNNENGFPNTGRRFSFDKLFRHLVLAAQVYAGDHVELSFGYNHLRRKELNIGQGGNGLNGFSVGAGLILKKLQLRYARSHYQNNTGYNQLGINMKLNEYFGLGRFGERIGW